MENSNILITGASSGIGEELVNRYIGRGNRLYLVARSCDKLKKIHSIESKNIDIFCRDLSDLKESEKLSQELSNISFDLIILNAGISLGHNSKSFTSVNDFNRLFNVNFLSIHSLLQHIVPNLKKGSKIVSISSLASIITMPSSIAYSSSKRAMNSYIEGLRYFLQPKGVEVINILPGFIETPLTDKNQFNMPFLMSLKDGVDRVEKAINGKKRDVYFPKRFYYLIRFIKALPHPIRDRVIGKFRK